MEKRSVKVTKTEHNLLKAFAGESQAKNRYTFFAKEARREGYERVADFFEETATNEEEHAKLFFKHLCGGMVEITAAYPAGIISNTEFNLEQAAAGEYDEWSDLYPNFARVAAEEGFKEIEKLFLLISSVEKHHEERFRKLHHELKESQYFKRKEKEVWRCKKCGYEHTSETAPQACPICKHPQAYFEVFDDKI